MTLDYLWLTYPIIWTAGHFLEILKLIISEKWVEGAKKLTASKTTKTMLQYIMDSESTLLFVDRLS